MSVYHCVIAQDSKNANTPVTGLSPAWVHITDMETGEKLDACELPKFRELGGGQYAFAFDGKPGRHYFGQIDLGPTLLDGIDRFVDFDFGFKWGGE